MTREPIEGEIDDRRRVQRQELRREQTADDRDAERPAELGAEALPERQRERPEQSGARSHQDGPEPQRARPDDGLLRGLTAGALGLDGKVDEEDGVLLHDPDEEKQTDDRDDAQVDAEE